MDADRLQWPITALCGGMTFLWLIAWASFTAAPLLGRPFPLSSALLTFTAAAAVAGWSHRRRWRNYQVLALQLVGLAICCLHTLHSSLDPITGVLGTSWLAGLGHRLQDIVGAMTAVLVVGWAVAFWVSGVRLVRRPLSYLVVCNRFDLGLTAFFTLLLVQMMLVVRGGVRIAAPPASLLAYAFFLFGLSAIGLARHRGTAEKRFVPGLRGIFVLLVFAGGIAGTAVLLAAVAPPFLAPLAEDGYELLQTAARPLGPILVRILRFIFNRDFQHPDRPAGTFENRAPDWLPEEGGGWWIWLARLIARGFLAALLAALAVLAMYLLWRAARWLLEKDAGPQRPRRQWNRWIEVLLRLWAWLRNCGAALFSAPAGNPDIGRLFVALQSWGRRCGLKREAQQTPREYAEFLTRRFPREAPDIDAIVTAFQRQVYGELRLAPGEIEAARSAWRRLRSPMLWPSRLRALFAGIGRPSSTESSR